MPSAVMPRRPLSLPYTKENPMKRKWMMVLGFLPLLMGIPPSHHLDAAPGLYLSKAGKMCIRDRAMTGGPFFLYMLRRKRF